MSLGGWVQEQMKRLQLIYHITALDKEVIPRYPNSKHFTITNKECYRDQDWCGFKKKVNKGWTGYYLLDYFQNKEHQPASFAKIIYNDDNPSYCLDDNNICKRCLFNAIFLILDQKITPAKLGTQEIYYPYGNGHGLKAIKHSTLIGVRFTYSDSVYSGNGLLCLSSADSSEKYLIFRNQKNEFGYLKLQEAPKDPGSPGSISYEIVGLESEFLDFDCNLELLPFDSIKDKMDNDESNLYFRYKKEYDISFYLNRQQVSSDERKQNRVYVSNRVKDTEFLFNDEEDDKEESKISESFFKRKTFQKFIFHIMLTTVAVFGIINRIVSSLGPDTNAARKRSHPNSII